MLKKLNFFVINAQAVSVLSSRLAELPKVLTLLTRFCKNIFVYFQVIFERKPVTDESFEISSASNFKQQLCLKTCAPKYLIEKY